MYWHVLCVYNIMYVYGSKYGTSTLAIAGCRFMRLMIKRILYYYVFCGKLQRDCARCDENATCPR